MEVVNLLVVEDDEEIRRLVTRELEKEGFHVDAVGNGDDAYTYFTHRNYALIILDLMLPGIDGFEILRRVRSKQQIPVLILSAKDEETDKVVGLGLGADDYLTKPFLIGELIARVKAQLRRYLYYQPTGEEGTSSLLQYHGLELDLHTFEVKVEGLTKSLTAKEFAVLKSLMSEPHRVFTKSHLFERVWEEPFSSDVDENTVMVHIRRLRKKIEKDPSNPKYIQTVWGIGYRLGSNDTK